MERFVDFYKNKKVLVTGNTGFKGSWLSVILHMLGADIYGYSLEAPTNPSLYEICEISNLITQYTGDIRDYNNLSRVVDEVSPEIVIHMAAQPLVRESYNNPVYTYEVNVLGTVNILEAIRHSESVKSVINVTTDKVYLNRELNKPFKEDEELCGFDPYSNSKSCSELVTYSYKNSFFGGDSCVRDNGKRISISTCRAGNVIGGGDFATDRIIPDCIRSIQNNDKMIVRNRDSIRPYQHVIEPLYVYLLLAMKQYDDISLADSYNIGPSDKDCITTGNLVDSFCKKWKCISDDNHFEWEYIKTSGPHEAEYLKLDSSKIRETLGYTPRWSIDDALDKIVEWTDCYLSGNDVVECMKKQINDYFLR